MGITCITGINPLQRAPVCAGYKITVIPLEGPVGVDGECSEHTQSRQRRGRKGSQLEKEGAVQCWQGQIQSNTSFYITIGKHFWWALMPQSEENRRRRGQEEWSGDFFFFSLVSQISSQIAVIINSPFAISWLWFADSALFMAAHEKRSAFTLAQGSTSAVQTQSSNFRVGTETEESLASHQDSLWCRWASAVVGLRGSWALDLFEQTAINNFLLQTIEHVPPRRGSSLETAQVPYAEPSPPCWALPPVCHNFILSRTFVKWSELCTVTPFAGAKWHLPPDSFTQQPSPMTNILNTTAHAEVYAAARKLPGRSIASW